MLILVANSKMGEMILFTPASEAQRNRVDSWVETPTSVGENRLERIRHQYQCWVWAYFNATALQAGAGPLWVCEGAFDVLVLSLGRRGTEAGLRSGG
jgi:hypothetical protein